jgi:hypothetical protein
MHSPEGSAEAGSAQRTAFLVNLVVFIACSALGFARIGDGLFYSYDGLYMLLEVLNRVASVQPLFAFSNDFLQSIGDIQVLQNPRLLFFLWPIWWLDDLHIARIAVYTVIAAIVFLSVYGLARTLQGSQTVALLAGWIIGVVATPLAPIPFFYPLLHVAPTAVVVVAAPVIGFWLLQLVGRASFLADGLAILGLAALILYLLAAAPANFVLLAPGAIPYLALVVLLVRRRAELIRKMAALAIVLLASIGLQWHLYLLGLFSNTAAGVFPADFATVYRDALYVSIMFHGPVYGWAGPALVSAAAIGAVLSLRRSDDRLRVAAWVLLAALLVLVASRVALLLAKDWILPAPIYVEVAAWPLYGLFAAITLHHAARFAVQWFPSGARHRWMLNGSVLPIPAALGAAAIALSHSPGRYAPFPPRLTPTVEFLKSSVALTQDSAFEGRVATIFPVDPNGEDAWVQQYSLSLSQWQSTGNDLMTVGLWYFRIPTLFQYNQFASPVFHALVKRMLQRPVVRHQRNITVFTHADIRILRLLGVRYVIGPEADISGVQRASEKVGDRQWGVFELPKPNLATYSPTAIEIRKDLASTLNYVADNNVDLTRSAVVREDVGGPLVTAQESSLSMFDGDLRVVARSTGRSLLVVPVEYSHCIELRNKAAEEPGRFAPRLVRVNAALSGVIFERVLDVVLAFRIGPLHNQTCRWQDYVELQSMLDATRVPPVGPTQ